jgi:hypothetical protein
MQGVTAQRVAVKHVCYARLACPALLGKPQRDVPRCINNTGNGIGAAVMQADKEHRVLAGKAVRASASVEHARLGKSFFDYLAYMRCQLLHMPRERQRAYRQLDD